MSDDLERYEPTLGTEAESIQRRARQAGVEAHALRPQADAEGRRRTTLTFFSEPRRVPEVGEKIEVRVEDGSWRRGYRAISGITTDEEYPGERVIWITPEDEWQAAKKEGREPGGAPWPVEQMAAVEDEADARA